MSNGKQKMWKALPGVAVSLVMALVLALVLAGCGSSKSDSSSGAKEMALSKDMKLEAPAAADNAFNAAQPSAAAYQAEAGQSSAAPAEAGAGGGIGPIADPGTGMNRKVIYKANVTMKVAGFDSAEEKLRNAIHQSGSYILEFSNTQDTSEKGATYVIKVPAEGFSSFIDQLRRIQKDLELQMQGSDVTEEYVDLGSRLQAKKTVEVRLLSFMEKATKSDDLVRFSSELAQVQEQIEQIKGRMRFLDQNVAYSTVNVRLYERVGTAAAESGQADGLGQRLTHALTGSAKALGQFGEALLVFLAALLPVAAVLAVAGVPAYYLMRAQRRNRRMQEQPSKSRTKTDSAPDNTE